MSKNNNSNLSEEQLNKISQRAKRDSAIKLQDLIYIMAADESYNDVLFKLWDIFDLNEANRIPQVKYGDGRLDINGNLKFKEDRAGAWWWVWTRLAIITEINEFYFKDLPPVINSLPLYCFTRGELIKVKDGNKKKENHFVKLDDLEEFLNDIERKFALTVPLPSELFPNHKDRISSRELPPEKIEPKEAIKYKDIMDKYKAKDFELIDIIRRELFEEFAFARDGYKAKLQPYSPASLRQIKVRDILSERKGHIFEEEKLDPNYSKEVGFVGDLLPRISECLTKQLEVEETLKKYGLYQEEEKRTEVILTGEDSQELVDLKEKKVTLPQTTKKKEEFLKDPNMIRLIGEIKNQIGIIYNALLKNVGFSGRENLNHADNLKQEAVDILTDQEGVFKYIKKNDLEDLNLYINMLSSAGHEFRYFEGTLLQKSVKNLTGKKIAKDKLRNI